MKKIIRFCFIANVILLLLDKANAQQKIFNLEIGGEARPYSVITSIAQDRHGYMWFGTMLGGILRYDGSKIDALTNNQKNSNSLAGNYVQTIFIDSLDIFWIGTFGAGLDRYDGVNKKFTHFRHDRKNAASLNNDTVTAILQDKSGNLWVGTYGGLNLLDPKSGSFTHYYNKPNDSTSLSYNHIRVLYEDSRGILWVGCGSNMPGEGEKEEDGGLNSFDKHTGKFTRYLHDPKNAYSIANNKVSAIFEDSKKNLWVGTAGDGLHTLDRTTGVFTHYSYNSTHSQKITRPPLHITSNDLPLDNITFIYEDAMRYIWIGSLYGGINQYFPETQKIIHHGYVYDKDRIIPKDTISGFKDVAPSQAISSKDGLLWIATRSGKVYTVNHYVPLIPYIKTSRPSANAFYEDQNGSLWIGTDSGLVYKEINKGVEKIFVNEAGDTQSLSNNTINSIQVDNYNKIWLGTYGGGVNKFDPITQKFTRYIHTEKKGSLSNNFITNVFFDGSNDLWIGTRDGGLNKFDPETALFTYYQHDPRDSNSLSDNGVICMAGDKKNNLWVGTFKGLNMLNKKNREI